MSSTLGELLERMSQRRVLVLGDVIVDEYVDGESSRVSAEAPVAVVRFTGRRTVLGGAGNTAANVASLGGRVALVGLVGDDVAGSEFIDGCAAAGIEFVPLRDGRPTTRKLRVVSQQQQLLRIDYEDTARHRRCLRAAPARGVRGSPAGLRHRRGVRLCERTAHGRGLPRARAGRARRRPGSDRRPPSLARVVLLVVRLPDAELARVAGPAGRKRHPDDARGNPACRLTRQPEVRYQRAADARRQGIAYVERSGGPAFIVPAEAQEVFDVSGAGDTVVAAFALARAAGCSAVEAVGVANRAAGIVVGKRGTATVTPDEMLEKGRADARLLDDAELPGLGDRQRRLGRRVVTVAGRFDDIRAQHLDLFAARPSPG